MNTFNKNSDVVAGFGDEWNRFDQSELNEDELKRLFEGYFAIFPWDLLSATSHGFDMGCGSGRWARLVANRVGKLHCIDPSSALKVAMHNLRDHANCVFHQAGVGDQILSDGSMDFGYSLGVLHHIPNTEQGIRDCVRMLKPGAPFLVYLYYALENRSVAYRLIWRLSNIFRVAISRLPFAMRYGITQLIAVFVYWPIARLAALVEYLGVSGSTVRRFPLGAYRHLSLYTMRTDALDRFGTRLEHRFTKDQIKTMMINAGLDGIVFSDNSPYWCAVGYKK